MSLVVAFGGIELGEDRFDIRGGGGSAGGVGAVLLAAGTAAAVPAWRTTRTSLTVILLGFGLGIAVGAFPIEHSYSRGRAGLHPFISGIILWQSGVSMALALMSVPIDTDLIGVSRGFAAGDARQA